MNLPCKCCGSTISVPQKYRRAKSALHADCEQYEQWLMGFLGIPPEACSQTTANN